MMEVSCCFCKRKVIVCLQGVAVIVALQLMSYFPNQEALFDTIELTDNFTDSAGEFFELRPLSECLNQGAVLCARNALVELGQSVGIHVFAQNASVVSHVVAARDKQALGGWLNNDVASLARLRALADDEILSQRRRLVVRFEPEVKRAFLALKQAWAALDGSKPARDEAVQAVENMLALLPPPKDYEHVMWNTELWRILEEYNGTALSEAVGFERFKLEILRDMADEQLAELASRGARVNKETTNFKLHYHPSCRHHGYVFAIGMFKTGTSMIAKHLKSFGYRPFQVFQGRLAKRMMDTATFVDFLRSEPVESEHVFSKLDVQMGAKDGPILFLFEDLDKAYPGSRFFLTERDPIDVVNSDQKMFARSSKNWGFWNRSLTELILDPKWKNFGYPGWDFMLASVRRYHTHHRLVTEYFSGRQDMMTVNWFNRSMTLENQLLRVASHLGCSPDLVRGSLSASSPKKVNVALEEQPDYVTQENRWWLEEWDKYDYTFDQGILISVTRDGLDATAYAAEHLVKGKH